MDELLHTFGRDHRLICDMFFRWMEQKSNCFAFQSCLPSLDMPHWCQRCNRQCQEPGWHWACELLPHLRMCHLGLLYTRQRSASSVWTVVLCCRNTVQSTEQDTSNVLINYRQLGRLIMPSDDVVKIVTFAELQLRCLSPLNCATLQCTSRKLQASVLQQFGDKPLFDIENHFSETQSGIDNHYFDMLRVIVDILLGLQQHYIICLHNIGLKNHVYVKKSNKIYIVYGTVSKNMFILFVNMFHFWFCRVWLTTHPSLIIILL